MRNAALCVVRWRRLRSKSRTRTRRKKRRRRVGRRRGEAEAGSVGDRVGAAGTAEGGVMNIQMNIQSYQ